VARKAQIRDSQTSLCDRLSLEITANPSVH
jgi:hypothetical protein